MNKTWKRFLMASVIVAFVLGCATLPVSKELLAKYYWSGINDKGVLTTIQVFPEKDCYWVEQEKINGDQMEVPFVWIDDTNCAIGVGFNDLKTPQELDYCGVMLFRDCEARNQFMETFDTNLIINGFNIECGQMVEMLNEQLDQLQAVK